MNDPAPPENEIQYCVNHPKRETAVQCGKCGKPICPQCMVQTPVGMRCRDCAQLRRLPQYDVKPELLLRSVPAGLLVSAVGWYLINFVPFLRFWLAFALGYTVGDVMSKLARRRSNIVLEGAAVLVTIGGFFLAYGVARAAVLASVFSAAGQNNAVQIYFFLPLVAACVMAVVRLRR